MKTANLAIVFTDIQGFSERTSRQTLEENERLLRAHGDLLIPVFKAFGGRILKSIGDAFLVTFESPTQAVLSGMAIQDRLWQYNQRAPDTERLDVRVAINVGEVRLEAQDVFGEPVNIAARVESITEAGEVFFTEAVYLAMNKAEVPAREVGLFELKGIPGKIRVFRVPHGPYRVGAPPEAEPAEPVQAQPPFGNLALARVPEALLTPGSDLAATAAQVGERLAQRTRTAILAVQSHRQRRWPPSPRDLKVGGAVLAGVLVVAALFFFLGDSPLEAALHSAADKDLPAAERNQFADKARKLITEDEALSPGRREWLLGRVDEAQQRSERALMRYRAAVKAGEPEAGSHIVQMLRHPNCRLRIDVADILGELRLASARDGLERLAKEGGPGEEAGLFGCNSRRAAEQALNRLGRERGDTR
ncbi:MAG: adenylate/guanylate cyclase domain-containing protein [Cystobacter sp.]